MERFSQGDLLRIVELQEEVYGLKQGSHTVTDYYTKLKSIWEELDNYRPMIPCMHLLSQSLPRPGFHYSLP